MKKTPQNKMVKTPENKEIICDEPRAANVTKKRLKPKAKIPANPLQLCDLSPDEIAHLYEMKSIGIVPEEWKELVDLV